MDGEFVVVESVRVHKGVAGGNLLIQSVNEGVGLDRLRRGIEAIRSEVSGVILPFPGGGVRSGSKVGSRYPALRASTSHQYCPTLRGRVDSLVHADAACVHEIVIDGIDEAAVRHAMLCGIMAIAGDGVVAISAGNYGGKLGKFHFHLHEIVSPVASRDGN